ncbi:4-(cytidine 5'-diphospho)-2-C-methyl-D-erythritol kinase, partial [Enterococcus faecium]
NGGDTLARGIAGRNDLQPAAERVAPQVAQVLAILRERPGVVLARMSGSGATCFALFPDMADRDAAAAVVAAEQPGWWRLASVVA